MAVACVFRALAEAGLGNEEDARWYWWTARSLFPDITVTDLSPYGVSGAFLRGLEFRHREGWDEPLVFGRRKGFKPPTVRRRKRPVFPDAARIHQLGGAYAAQVVVDVDGAISGPLILRDVVDPSLAYAVLETLRGWKFSPATLNGKPVRSVYATTINFRFR